MKGIGGKSHRHFLCRYHVLIIFSVSVPPEIEPYISKIPFQLAEDYAKQHASGHEGIYIPTYLFNKDIFEKIQFPLARLFAPVVLPEAQTRAIIDGMLWPVGPTPISYLHLNDMVLFCLRMWTSQEQFEFRWANKTMEDGSVVDQYPWLYVLAGPDGVLLDEPKVVYEGEEVNMAVRAEVSDAVEAEERAAKTSQRSSEEETAMDNQVAGCETWNTKIRAANKVSRLQRRKIQLSGRPQGRELEKTLNEHPCFSMVNVVKFEF